MLLNAVEPQVLLTPELLQQDDAAAAGPDSALLLAAPEGDRSDSPTAQSRQSSLNSTRDRTPTAAGALARAPSNRNQ